MAETNEEEIKELKKTVAGIRKMQQKVVTTVLSHETMSHEKRLEKTEKEIAKIKSGYVENGDCMRMTHLMEEKLDDTKKGLIERIEGVKADLIKEIQRIKSDKIRLVGWLLSASGWAGIFIALYTLMKRLPPP